MRATRWVCLINSLLAIWFMYHFFFALCLYYLYCLTDVSIFWIQKLFKGKDDQLSVIGRLAAGACAGMTSTLVSNCCSMNLLLGKMLFKLSIKIWLKYVDILIYQSDSCILIFMQLTYPLDVLRLRLAVEPGYRTMSQVKWFFILSFVFIHLLMGIVWCKFL